MAFVIIEPVRAKPKVNKPFVSISPRTGRIIINVVAMRMMELAKEKALSVLYNDEDSCYYITKAIGSKAYAMRPKYNKVSTDVAEGIMANNDLALKLREAYGKETELKTFRLEVCPNPVKHMGDKDLYKLINPQEG